VEGADPAYRFLSCDIRQAAAITRSAADDRKVLVLGGQRRRALAAGLVDEILVHVLPTVLSDGIRLFSGSTSQFTSAGSWRSPQALSCPSLPAQLSRVVSPCSSQRVIATKRP
jgi:dihydrofolate reductase